MYKLHNLLIVLYSVHTALHLFFNIFIGMSTSIYDWNGLVYFKHICTRKIKIYYFQLTVGLGLHMYYYLELYSICIVRIQYSMYSMYKLRGEEGDEVLKTVIKEMWRVIGVLNAHL